MTSVNCKEEKNYSLGITAHDVTKALTFQVGV